MWQKLLGGQYGFFDLFNRHAAATMEGAKSLLELCDEFPDISAKVEKIDGIEHECDSITHMTVDMLHRSFITPLDQDEILRLSSKLDDVMDSIDRAAKTMLLFEIKDVPHELKEMIRVLAKAQEQVVEAVALIPGFKYGDKIRDILKEIHGLENEGDRRHHAGIVALFRENENNAILVIKLKAIYETVEKAIDRCEDVAEIVENILLEHF